MRIIAGKFKGKKLKTPSGRDIRPTTGRLRESIFDALTHRLSGGFEGKEVGDLFAGTGAFGLEALSRGAKKVFFVEKHPQSLNFLESNIDQLGAGEAARITREPAQRL